MLFFGVYHFYFFMIHPMMPWADKSEIAIRACSVISEHLNLYEKVIKCDFVNRNKILLRAYGFRRDDEIDNLRRRAADVRDQNFKEFEIEVIFDIKQ